MFLFHVFLNAYAVLYITNIHTFKILFMNIQSLINFLKTGRENPY